jgi:benzoylformate decarboxylase
VRDLGRTYVTKLSVVGEIKATLRALLPWLDEATKSNSKAYTMPLQKAEQHRAMGWQSLETMVATQMDSPNTTPLVAAREAVRAIGPDIAIVDEAAATSSQVENSSRATRQNQYSFIRGGGLGWGMPAAVGCSLDFGRAPVVCLIGDGAVHYSPQALWTAAHEPSRWIWFIQRSTMLRWPIRWGCLHAVRNVPPTLRRQSKLLFRVALPISSKCSLALLDQPPL